MEELEMFFAEIEERREELGMDKKEIADIIGVSLSAYCHLEKRSTSFKKLKAIAEALGMKIVVCIVEKEEA